MKIGIIGMGKLGLPCALAIEKRGHEVNGYDIDPKIEEFLLNKKIPYKEEGVEELLQNTKINIVSLNNIVDESDIIFVAIQTPHDMRYEGITSLPKSRIDFDYNYLKNGIQSIIDHVVDHNKSITIKNPHKEFIVVIISTVLPGTLNREIFPLIPDGLTNLNIVYNPFFIAMGTTINDFLNPEIVLLGSNDINTSKKVQSFYESLHNFETRITRLPKIFTCSIETAEAIKVLYNTFITQKIVFINAAMELCEKTGADIDDVSDALSLCHKRIVSPMYMRGGMGDGGGCHIRDNIALSHISKKLNLSFDIWETLILAREKQTEWFAEILYKYHKETGLDIFILGYTFKPETNLIVGSPAILLKNILNNYQFDNVLMFDPYIDEAIVLNEKKIIESDIEHSMDKINIILSTPKIFFIGTKHKIFQLYKFPNGSVVIDPFRYIPDQDGVFIKRLGQNKN